MKNIKNIITGLLIAMILATVCTSMVSAVNDTYTYEIEGTEYTVEITDANITNEKKQAIADSMVGADESEIMTANVWCDLFGHDYKYTTASVVTHKARTYAPRCKRQLFDVTYCDDCDYTEQTLTSTMYIVCCAED